MSKLGYVYVSSNPAMPEWIKVGEASDAEQRVRTTHSDTTSRYSSPEPWALEWKIASCDCIGLEHLIHAALAAVHTRHGEMFKCSVDTAIRAARLTTANNPAKQLDGHVEVEVAKIQVEAERAARAAAYKEEQRVATAAKQQERMARLAKEKQEREAIFAARMEDQRVATIAREEVAKERQEQLAAIKENELARITELHEQAKFGGREVQSRWAAFFGIVVACLILTVSMPPETVGIGGIILIIWCMPVLAGAIIFAGAVRLAFAARKELNQVSLF